MADILIRGMEMPEYCYDCPCHNGESGYCQLYKDGYLSSIERPAKCPLVPLPEGHGRLIDENYLLVLLSDEEHFGCLNVSDILNAPTIAPAEGGGEDG